MKYAININEITSIENSKQEIDNSTIIIKIKDYQTIELNNFPLNAMSNLCHILNTTENRFITIDTILKVIK